MYDGDAPYPPVLRLVRQAQPQDPQGTLATHFLRSHSLILRLWTLSFGYGPYPSVMDLILRLRSSSCGCEIFVAALTSAVPRSTRHATFFSSSLLSSLELSDTKVYEPYIRSLKIHKTHYPFLSVMLSYPSVMVLIFQLWHLIFRLWSSSLSSSFSFSFYQFPG